MTQLVVYAPICSMNLRLEGGECFSSMESFQIFREPACYTPRPASCPNLKVRAPLGGGAACWAVEFTTFNCEGVVIAICHLETAVTSWFGSTLAKLE